MFSSALVRQLREQVFSSNTPSNFATIFSRSRSQQSLGWSRWSKIGLVAELTKIVRCKSGYGAYHRIMAAPAITRPRNAGTNIGGTSHSRRLNFWIDILTASFFGRSSNSLSPIDAKGWTVMDRSRYSFPHNVELNLKKIGEPKTPRFHRNRVDTGSRSIHITEGALIGSSP